MLTFSRKNGRFDIAHTSKQTGRQLVYSFSNDFLPAATAQHVNALGIFSRKKVIYRLSPNDDRAVGEVMRKLDSEKHSTYIFSHLLQKTYLIELIHVITKLHFRNTV